MTEPLIVSLHIPKTAGTTLLRIFAEHFGPRLQRAYQPPKPGLPPTETDGWPDIENPLCIHGHAVLERFPWVRNAPNARFITFMRDPLAGAVSLWRHQQRLIPWDPSRPPPPRQGAEEFLIAHYNHNRYRKWLERSERPLEKFFFVGVVERFDTSIEVLANLCGWPKPNYQHDKAPGQPPPLDPTLIENFRRRNAEDYALYEQANSLLDEHLQRLRP